MEERNADRNAEIYARRCGGLTLDAIALEFQLSKETVREIARRMERKVKWRTAQDLMSSARVLRRCDHW
jgi:DNA-binding CsgD family transcriptional regulator